MRYSYFFRPLSVGLLLLMAQQVAAQTQAQTQLRPPTPFIGINTTSPTQALDIEGNLRIRAQAGSGTRMMVALPDGTLGVQPMPVPTPPDNLGNHTASQTLYLSSQTLRLRTAADPNHGLMYSANLNSRPVNGPVLFGDEGGVLATAQGGTMLPVITWSNSGRVGVGLNGGNPNATLHVGGTVLVDALAGSGSRVLLTNADGRLTPSTASATALEKLLTMKSGAYFVGPDLDGVYFSPIISFGTTYPTTPVVVCSVSSLRAQHQPLSNDTFTVSVRDCGLTGFQVAVARIGGGGWGQDIQINWVAMPQ